MKKQRLLLWDIDGTLISTDGAGYRAIEVATAQRFGHAGNLEGVEIGGRTDRSIAQQILTKYREPLTEENLSTFLDLYLDVLERELPHSKGKVLPGILELLQRTHERDDAFLGLLTGNLQRGARLKLQRYQLWDFFRFGAFADDHHDRNQLGPFALTRAEHGTGQKFHVKDIDVIGDTGHDVACGKALGARTIAVASGSWSRERLAECSPDFLFDDLSDVEEVVAKLDW